MCDCKLIGGNFIMLYLNVLFLVKLFYILPMWILKPLIYISNNQSIYKHLHEYLLNSILLHRKQNNTYK